MWASRPWGLRRFRRIRYQAIELLAHAPRSVRRSLAEYSSKSSELSDRVCRVEASPRPNARRRDQLSPRASPPRVGSCEAMLAEVRRGFAFIERHREWRSTDRTR